MSSLGPAARKWPQGYLPDRKLYAWGLPSNDGLDVAQAAALDFTSGSPTSLVPFRGGTRQEGTAPNIINWGPVYNCGEDDDPAQIECQGAGTPDVVSLPVKAAQLYNVVDGDFAQPILPWVNPPYTHSGPPFSALYTPLDEVLPPPDWALVFVACQFAAQGYYTSCLFSDSIAVPRWRCDGYTLDTPELSVEVVDSLGGRSVASLLDPDAFDVFGIDPKRIEGGTYVMPGGGYTDPLNPVDPWDGYPVGDSALWRYEDLPETAVFTISGDYGEWVGTAQVIVTPFWVAPPTFDAATPLMLVV